MIRFEPLTQGKRNPHDRDMIVMKYTHFTLEEREVVESLLNEKKNFKEIARVIGKSPSGVAKEIHKHIVLRRSSLPGRNYNNCDKRFTCSRERICMVCSASRKYKLCRRCSMCNSNCKEYEPAVCRRHIKPPYVCNGCGKRGECTLEKHLYIAQEADRAYRTKLSESRSGSAYTEEELKRLDEIISPLIKQKQSPHHIWSNNKDTLMVSERTIYNLIDARLISAMNLDLPRKMRFKARKTKKTFKVDKSCRIGRDFACFNAYMEEHPDSAVVQLDSVEGKKGGKVLLTVHFVKCEMMLAILRDANDSKSVTDFFLGLFEKLGTATFQRLFPILLADNGSEFSNPAAIEFDANGNRRTHFFYCNPNAPYQKGSAERNHEFIREFVPKGEDFGKYTQEDITLMMNHINSYGRDSLADKCPYDVFRYLYGDELFQLMNCVIIPANDVTLNKSIWKKEMKI